MKRNGRTAGPNTAPIQVLPAHDCRRTYGREQDCGRTLQTPARTRLESMTVVTAQLAANRGGDEGTNIIGPTVGPPVSERLV